MKKIQIKGNTKLSGNIQISGAKNSVVALIPAAIMSDGIVEIDNVPKLSDTLNLRKIVNLLGGKIDFGNNKLVIDSSSIVNKEIPAELSGKLRASYYFMGALLGKFKKVEINLPGGCSIGARPMDLHFKGFKALGATIVTEGDKFVITANKLHGADIYLDFPSVGATINILLASVLADGTTTIKNAAKEPEIENIADLLNNMGASISGAGTNTITINGVKKLHDAKVRVIPDRIEAGTYIMMGALVGDNLKISGIIPKHLESLFDYLDKMNINYVLCNDSILISKCNDIKPCKVETGVYPEFPTDLGQPMTVLLSMGKGKSFYKENIYENRMGQIPEIIKMGADIQYDYNSATIEGPTKYIGKEVSASDLRAGASLILASLIADGTTEISNIEHILRGYEDICDKINNVGGNICIIDK